MRSTKSNLALQHVESENEPTLERLRSRLLRSTQSSEREAVVVDMLEDDLRETLVAFEAVAGHLTAVSAMLQGGKVTGEQLLDWALDNAPLERIDYLTLVLSDMRRRMLQVAAKL